MNLQYHAALSVALYLKRVKEIIFFQIQAILIACNFMFRHK